MRAYGKIETGFWADEAGVVRRCPEPGTKLRFSSSAHAALRAFVFRRDRFTCQKCGWMPEVIPLDFTGRHTVAGPDPRWDTPEMYHRHQEMHLDHIVARHYGGANHPDNLQALCFTCNASKQHRMAA
jgi:hypothetical protein